MRLAWGHSRRRSTSSWQSNLLYSVWSTEYNHLLYAGLMYPCTVQKKKMKGNMTFTPYSSWNFFFFFASLQQDRSLHGYIASETMTICHVHAKYRRAKVRRKVAVKSPRIFVDILNHNPTLRDRVGKEKKINFLLPSWRSRTLQDLQTYTFGGTVVIVVFPETRQYLQLTLRPRFLVGGKFFPQPRSVAVYVNCGWWRGWVKLRVTNKHAPLSNRK